MRIGFFCDEFPPKSHGGIGTFVENLAGALAIEGHQVCVTEFGRNAGERLQDGVRVITLRRSKIAKIGGLVDRWRLRRWIKVESHNDRLDVFEIPEFHGWLPLPLSGSKTKIVVRLHLSATAIRAVAASKANLTQVIFRFLEWATLRFNRNWIGVSKHVVELTRNEFRLSPQHVSVIYNPATVTDRQIASLENSSRPCPTRYVLFVGSLSARKGVLTLAAAADRILSKGGDLRFVFIGPECAYNGNPISEEICRICGGRHGQHIAVMGALSHDETLRWIRHAEVLVLPSRLEAFGLTITEAMALGVPVVFTTVGPGPELVRNGVDGLLVEPDDPTGLAEAIETITRNPSYAATLGRNGKTTVQSRFSLASCANGSVEFYRSLLDP
jgi:glycosyltransferase involved in cell wall biosynthesis